MLIEFAVSNFRSIKERQVLTFKADMNVTKKDLPDNLIKSKWDKDTYFINSAVIFGANASGKSNLLKGLHALEFMITKSDEFKLDKSISSYEPFKLDKTSKQEPTIFEIEFVAKDELRYRYVIHFSKYKIEKERLTFFPNQRSTVRESLLFLRNEDLSIEFGTLYQGKKDFTVNPNQLVLSQAGVAHPSIVEAYRFFSTYLFYAPAHLSVFDEAMLKMAETHLLEASFFKNAIVSLIGAADTGISDIFIQKLGEDKFKFPEDMPEDEKQKLIAKYRNRIKTVHPIYENDELVGEEFFDLSEESTGTMKLLGLAGFVVGALRDGSTVIVDELDKSLHPLLSRMMIELFQNREQNPKSAQLIFSSHDISLIDKKLFRRDQIYLIDKNMNGASTVARLSDFRGISKVETLQKWYLNGLFKGVPAINAYEINLNFAEENV